MAKITALYLERFAYTPEGTLGRLALPERTIYTLKPPWRDNQVNISCIPEGPTRSNATPPAAGNITGCNRCPAEPTLFFVTGSAAG